MARRKMYFRYEIPSNVVCIVKSLCVDYERRELALKNPKLSSSVLDEYKRLNNAIDIALLELEVGIRKIMLNDVQHGRGYEYSRASSFIAKNTYYSRKRKLIYDIAKELKLYEKKDSC